MGVLGAHPVVCMSGSYVHKYLPTRYPWLFIKMYVSVHSGGKSISLQLDTNALLTWEGVVEEIFLSYRQLLLAACFSQVAQK